MQVNGKNILDLGVGTGNVIQLLNKAATIVGIDITESKLKATKIRYPDLFLIQADGRKIPLKKTTFDVITAIGLVEYLQNPEPLFQEANRILINSGYFVITFSPVGVWTILRLLLGHRIQSGNLKQFMQFSENNGFRMIHQTRSFIQHQLLLQKH